MINPWSYAFILDAFGGTSRMSTIRFAAAHLREGPAPLVPDASAPQAKQEISRIAGPRLVFSRSAPIDRSV